MQISRRRVIQAKGRKITKGLRWERSSVSVRDRKIANLAENAASAENKGSDNVKEEGRDQIQNIFTYQIQYGILIWLSRFSTSGMKFRST